METLSRWFYSGSERKCFIPSNSLSSLGWVNRSGAGTPTCLGLPPLLTGSPVGDHTRRGTKRSDRKMSPSGHLRRDADKAAYVVSGPWTRRGRRRGPAPGFLRKVWLPFSLPFLLERTVFSSPHCHQPISSENIHHKYCGGVSLLFWLVGCFRPSMQWFGVAFPFPDQGLDPGRSKESIKS